MALEDQLATTLCATVKPQNKANATLRTSSPSPSLSTPDNNYNNNQNNLNKNVNDNNNNNTDNKYNKSYGRIEQGCTFCVLVIYSSVRNERIVLFLRTTAPYTPEPRPLHSFTAQASTTCRRLQCRFLQFFKNFFKL